MTLYTLTPTIHLGDLAFVDISQMMFAIPGMSLLFVRVSVPSIVRQDTAFCFPANHSSAHCKVCFTFFIAAEQPTYFCNVGDQNTGSACLPTPLLTTDRSNVLAPPRPAPSSTTTKPLNETNDDCLQTQLKMGFKFGLGSSLQKLMLTCVMLYTIG